MPRKARAAKPAAGQLSAALARIAQAEKALVPVGRFPVPVDAEALEHLAILVERKVGKKMAVLTEALKLGLSVMVDGSAVAPPLEALPLAGAEDYRGADDAPLAAWGNEGKTTPTHLQPVIPSPGSFFGSGTMGGAAIIRRPVASSARPLSETLGTPDGETYA